MPFRWYDLLAALERWWVGCLARQLERAAIAQLSRLSDRELKDIGQHRSQIPAAARGDATSLRMSLHHYCARKGGLSPRSDENPWIKSSQDRLLLL